MLRLELFRTYTTDTALARSPEKRQCFKRNEHHLEHFDVYTQNNCIANGYINAIHEVCGCVGRHRGEKFILMMTFV